MQQHALREPSWLVGRVTSKVPVVEVLLASRSIRVSVGQRDAEGTGGLLSGSAATMSQVPAQGDAQSEHVALSVDAAR